jgi:UDP-N-acetylglucosamine/UDP-N-acetyl-alpha-D-glucosaminouronate 4-epimerase
VARWVVTGGAGFIGSHLAETLAGRGEHVRVADSFITGRRENLAAIRRPFELVEGDLADEDVARRAVAGADYVLHQAAIPSVPRSVEDPLTSHRANVDATLQLLLAARDAGVRRVVYAGSSSAYGDQDALAKREDMPTRPLSPYALQKLVGEQYMRLFTTLYGLETVSLRYFNVFGPRQDPSSPYSGVIALFVTALMAGRPVTITGDGGQTRDFTYVANIVDGVLKAAEAPGVAGEVINVATGQEISINELAATLGDILGAPTPPLHIEARPGDVRHSLADITKARTLLGYEPTVDLTEGLRKTVDWYRAAP